MTRGLTRRIALGIFVFFLAQSVGGLQLLAANGSVRGHLAIEGGAPPPGALVRATPLDGGPAMNAPIGADLTYQFPALMEGAYLFEVTDASGRALGPGTRTLVPPGVLQLNLRVRIQSDTPPPVQPMEPQKVAPVTPPAPPPDKPGRAAAPAEPAPEPDQPGPGMTSTKKWTIMGVILGSLGVGLAVGNNSGNDNGGSPSQP